MGKRITDAIVVRLVDYGEADRVVTLITRDAGKVVALARRARASRKRFGGALELFGSGEAVLAERRGELWSLETFHAQRGFPHLALDVAKVAHAAYACEIVRELSPAQSPDERVYHLLGELLLSLDEGEPSAALLRVFELRLLKLMGLAPALDRCVGCGDLPSEINLLDARRGGLVCGACGTGQGTWTIAPSTRTALIDAQRAALPAARELAFSGRDAEATRDFLQAVLREHLGKPLRSVEFIAKLNGAGKIARDLRKTEADSERAINFA